MKTTAVGMGIVLTLAGIIGCTPTPGGGGGGAEIVDDDGDGGGDGTGGGVTAGGFDANGLAAPEALPADVENVPPSGDVVFPTAGAIVGTGEVVFVWEASDANATNVDSTVYLNDQPNVFESPLATPGLRTSSDETEHRLTAEFGEPGIFYWGVEITDGVNTVRRPTSEVGIEFEVSPGRGTLPDAILLCPREGLPARQVTTFHWSLDQTVPVSTEVYVSRAGLDNPFDSPLRVFTVDPPGETSWAITEADALPLDQELSWGLRIETADEVLFTFAGQLGVSFVVEENVPPSGRLLAPENDAVLPDNALLDLVWEDDPGNCEDVLTLTIGLEFLGEGTEPDDLFGSDVQLTAQADSAEADLFPLLADLELAGGRWAWGILADDGTDSTVLPDAEDPTRTFRTISRDTHPEFTEVPLVVPSTCGQDALFYDALTFAYADANGADTVTVSLSYAAAEADVFGDGATTTTLTQTASGTSAVEVTVFLADPGAAGCQEFVHGTGFYGVQLDDGVNDPVQEVIHYTEQITGACCGTDGLCSQVPETQCVSGDYLGDGSTCDTADCALFLGACCLSDGDCTDGPPDACTSGTYQGDGTTCAATQCPQPVTGACCLADNSCQDVPAASCSGTYQGDATACATVQCGVQVLNGACCLPNGGCVDVPSASCNGTYRGDGTTCAQVICPPR